MVARKFLLHHNDSNFDVEYDTDDGFEVFKFQLFSLTSIPPDEQKIFGGDDDRLVSDESDLASVTDKLRLVSINEEKKPAADAELVKSDEELARMLQAEEEALMFQQYAVVEDKGKGQIEQIVRPYINQVLMYEDMNRQEEARKTVPVERLEEKALVALAKEGNFKPSKSEQDDAFLLQLLFWFKQSFRWVHAPPCDSCGNETINQGMGVSIPSETQYGASRVELYRCNTCSRITRFPRYNDPVKLLETRRGRCGEWANCFTLYCRAFGYESRLIMDLTDHIWTECFSPFLGRWMHLDPCEGIYDNPLLYEKGWQKKLNYVIAIAKDGVCDVTKRYTRKWHEVLTRRNITTEPVLSTLLSNITRECRKNFTSQVLSALEQRDRNEAESLERDLHSKDDASISLPGRLSGDKEWRISRSEFGSDENEYLSSSSCPVRKCIDEHVTKIYNGFCPIISHFVEKSFSKSRAVEVLKFFRGILINLKNCPFRMRRTSINSVSKDAQYFVNQLLPSFNQLLDALSLKSELVNGSVDICLAADPVKTSIALPVVFHALDDVIHNVNKCDNFSKDSLAWPLLKSNRICSGLVLASGEELPFGIATSAFDGTRMSKWEEPNGARDCWLIYKSWDNRKHELVAYELMSANDAPERDPMDWILEGSDNGGSSWRVLDKQTSQMFDNRFQRKTFKISSQGFRSNAFRFKCLAVRDVQATSRFQIGSIDLYAKLQIVVIE
ncbi:peptide-N(4)-(N-acetyl-beta-glucosaminyl)asparagine amidase [Cornus florida]|uniref:peptide-N(4)-(N-acetyl-beta- glucosaminyl)asparagine amidase n=1 Tax=Cornus florida TaxID=4283 RepID=UPI0028A24521|nr:peptide-N(4)-(N-acetyl-beta-glucosaminyl)asparagine amidase [Cornus florida]